MNDKLSVLRAKAMSLPLSPGIYIMKNKRGEIIYIGKAKKLKNRVSSYFGADTAFSEKVRKMVSNVEDFDYILVDSEYESLMLECSLIKLHMPKYNIKLKDDKGYHYIKITRGDWRTISASLQKPNDDSDVLGPFTSFAKIMDIVEQACKIYMLPTCNKIFPRDIKKGGRPCLNFYIKQCSAPCSGKINQRDYAKAVDEALNFITNGSTKTLKELKKEMEEAAENLDFERAAKLRDRIAAIEKIGSKQKVVSLKARDVDVFALATDKDKACLTVFRFQNGNMYDSEYFFINQIDSLSNARMQLLLSYYTIRENIPPQISIDGEVEDSRLLEEHFSKMAGRKVRLVIPEKGEQVRLVEMCRNNAFEKLAQQSGREGKKLAAAEELAELLGLENPPEYIESFDISHTAGSDNVAGMVVFQDGKPYKKAYKRFMIKGFEGQDDYASMREVLERRFDEYEMHKEEGEGFGRLPDLILLDGGVGQVNAVKGVLEEHSLNIPLFGMVKDSKHKTRAITSGGGEISITSKRKAFTFISEIQEEVHRFSVEYHRKKHAKRNLNLSLREIEGVGEARAKLLLKHFKTLTALAEASVEEINIIKGISLKTAQNIYNYYHTGENSNMNTIDISNIKAAIFDMDGTLLNTLDDLADSVNFCLAAFSMPPRRYDEVRSFVGDGIPKLIERAVPNDTPAELIAQCTKMMLEHYAAHCNIKTAPYDGILALLKALRENDIKTAVVTNKAQQMAQVLCEEIFMGLIDVVIGAREGMPLKPAPDGLFTAMKELDISGDECIFVGDSDVDILTAKNANLKSIGVLWGFRDRDVLENSGADIIISNAEEILNIILKSQNKA